MKTRRYKTAVLIGPGFYRVTDGVNTAEVLATNKRDAHRRAARCWRQVARAVAESFDGKSRAHWRRKSVANRLADLDKVNRKLATATKPERAAYAADARKAAGVSKTPPRGFQRPKKSVSDGQPPPPAACFALADALNKAGLISPGWKHDGQRRMDTARTIFETASALGKSERVPCLRFDLYFVGHGYQVDVLAGGKDTGVGGCQDFGGTYAVSYVKDEFYKAILAAIDKAGRKL